MQNANKPSQLSSDGGTDAENRVAGVGALGVTITAKISVFDPEDDEKEGHECRGSH